MANTSHGNANANANAWNAAAAERGYAVHNGMPIIGISPDDGDGYLVSLPAPEGFAALSEGLQGTVFQALAEHALRAGQGAAKKKGATRDDVVKTVHSVTAGTHRPGKERDKDILSKAALAQFDALVRPQILAAAPTATEAAILSTIEKAAESDDGKAALARMRNEIAERGTYTVSRKSGKVEPIKLQFKL